MHHYEKELILFKIKLMTSWCSKKGPLSNNPNEIQDANPIRPRHLLEDMHYQIKIYTCQSGYCGTLMQMRTFANERKWPSSNRLNCLF